MVLSSEIGGSGFIVLPEFGTMIFKDVNPQAKHPHFKTRDVAIFFFQLSPAWLRWRQTEGYFTTVEGEQIEPEKEKNARKFSLMDIERIAYSFYGHGIINIEKLTSTLRILVLVGKGYGVIN